MVVIIFFCSLIKYLICVGLDTIRFLPMKQSLVNLVPTTVNNANLWSMEFQDVSLSMRSGMVSAVFDTMNDYVMNGSCAKQILFVQLI